MGLLLLVWLACGFIGDHIIEGLLLREDGYIDADMHYGMLTLSLFLGPLMLSVALYARACEKWDDKNRQPS